MTGSRILIVEDEAITAMELEETLKKRGYDVVGTAANGGTAIRIAKEKWPDLILMDIRIEGKIDGIETANQIGLSHDIPIIFLTAYSDDVTLARAIKTKSHSFMLKPFNEKELYSNIELAIGRHRDHQKSLAFERIAGSMFDLLSEGVITTDNAGIIRRVNANAEKITGQKRNDLAGKPFLDAIGFIPVQKPLIAAMITSAGSAGEPAPKPCTVILKNPTTDEKTPVTVKVETARMPDGAISEMIFVISPVPE